MTYKEHLMEVISDYFNIGDSYTYNLTRVKEGFDVGTVTLEDFEEFTKKDVEDLVDYIIKHSL